MGHHRSRRKRWLPVVVALAAAALFGGVIYATGVPGTLADGDRPPATTPTDAPAPAPTRECAVTLRVVSATSFAEVLARVTRPLGHGDHCVRVLVDVADGRGAAAALSETGADVWIPDDLSWHGLAGLPSMAEPGVMGSGTVLATSPIHLVTDKATARRVARSGPTWADLSRLAGAEARVRLVVRDAAGSGDGMLAAGALADAVWLERGMDASAEALSDALPGIRTVDGAAPALPRRTGEVGVVPEYALVRQAGRAGDSLAGLTLLAPTDHTAALRFAWLPTAAAAADPARGAALVRLLSVLTGPDADQALHLTGLRMPRAPLEPPGGTVNLPRLAPLFDVFTAHKLDHVFAAWYSADRRSNTLVVVDVSGSMAQPAPGSGRPLIDEVRAGFLRLGELLPDHARLALWEFGSRLDPPRDHRVLLRPASLGKRHRAAAAEAAARLYARDTGTGLYDTTLAAFVAARDGFQPGIPNNVVVFTDGRNEDDPGSISSAELARRLATAQRRRDRPVSLTVVTFGPEPDARTLTKALEPVGGLVSRLSTADQVRAVFIHVAAGGLHSSG